MKVRSELLSPMPGAKRRGNEQTRILWLDGVRALAAIYVMLHHIWLAAFPQFPHDGGPWIAGWLLYGHLGVAVFIVVSGYSLMLQPARNGSRLPHGTRRFGRDRAWRILPPYWAALILSVFVVDVIVAPPPGAFVGAKSIIVHGLLLQDVFGSVNPNGAFWSIAVECQIYLLFPMLLWLFRRRGPVVTAGTVAVFVAASHVLADRVYFFHRINQFTPALLILFVFGMVAASPSVRARLAKVPPMVPIVLAGLFVVGIAGIGPESTVAHYFWVDVAAGVVVATIFAHLTVRPAALAARVLGRRALTSVGKFSYSLYLTHAPTLGLIWLFVVQPHVRAPEAAFALELLLAVPACLIVAYVFFLVCERPFLTRRSLAAWLEIARRSPARVPAHSFRAPRAKRRSAG